MIKKYYYLTKPGIIYGNSLSVIAGFFLASRGNFNPLLFVATLVGLALVMASGCVFNNYLDRGIDEKMERTKRRAFVTKKIPTNHGLLFGTLLGLVGFGLLYLFTNLLTTVIAAVGFFFYVLLYTPLKPKTVYGTLIGSVAGAVPPVVGYVAVTNHFDMAAFLLFLLLVLWQMPHFYSIAIFRITDYKQAGIPVLPIVKGIKQTKLQIITYIILYILILPFLTIFGYLSYLSLVILLLISLAWLFKGIKGFRTADNTLWARKMFKFSLIVLLTFCVMISLNSV